jgi:diguanylate cyclase (GGDEF)-like protein/PAS domain S-box-containing protein
LAKLCGGDFPARHESYWLGKRGQRWRLGWRNTVVFGCDGEPSHLVSTAVRVTDERGIEAELLDSEGRFLAVVRSMLDPFWICSPVIDERGVIVDFRYEYVNDAACRRAGLAREQMLGHRVCEVFPGYQSSDIFPLFRNVAQTGEPDHAEELSYETEWAGSRETRTFDASVVPFGRKLAITSRDTTEHRRAERELQLRFLAEIIDSAHDAVLATTTTGLIVEWNRGAEELYGYTVAEALGQHVAFLSPPDLVEEQQELLKRVAAGEVIIQHETERLRKDGVRLPISVTISPIRDASGHVVRTGRIARDISDRKRHEGDLVYRADHDPLTGVFNRRRFLEELERELARARRDQKPGALLPGALLPGALLAIDIDHFKSINDSRGHHVGDQILTRAAEIFKTNVRDTDVVARPGGDEFAVILRNVSNFQARLVATKLLEAIRREGKVESASGILGITVSIGIALFNSDEKLGVSQLLEEADAALYDAKAAGRDRIKLYRPEEPV